MFLSIYALKPELFKMFVYWTQRVLKIQILHYYSVNEWWLQKTIIYCEKKWNSIHFSLLPKKKSCHHQQKYKNVAFTIQNILTFSYDKILEVKLYVYLFVNDIWKDFVQKQLLFKHELLSKQIAIFSSC